MSELNSTNGSLKDGFHYHSPITRVIALGYYDGPTSGVLQCGDNGPVYKFDLLAGPFFTEEGTEDLRVFALAPLPVSALATLAQAFQRHWPPRWPVWVPVWSFADAADEDAMNQLTDQVLAQAGPTQWVVATFNLTDEIQAAKRVTIDELSRVTDWLAFLGVPNEAALKE